MSEMNLAFFGAFNPPTHAHLDLALCALRAEGAEKVIFVPSKATYIRGEQGKDFAFSDDQRLVMLRACAKTRPWMAVTDWETRQHVQPRTYETLCLLRDRGLVCALLIGSDKLRELDRWWRIDDLAREFGIVCLARGADECEDIIGSRAGLRALAGRIHIVPTPEQTRDTSSTAARQTVSQMKRLARELRQTVPGEVARLLIEGVLDGTSNAQGDAPYET